MLKTISLPSVFSHKKADYSAPAKSLYKPKQAAFKRHVRPAYLWASYGLIAVNALLMLWYLFGVNSYASQGYEMSSIQKRIDQLAVENKKLNVKYSESSSLVSVQSNFASSQFVPVTQATYLQQTQLTQR